MHSTTTGSASVVGMFVRSLGVVAVLAFPLLPALAPVDRTPGVDRPSVDSTTWEESYSRRFPGCVSIPLWPQDERPVALVTRTRDGQVDRVPLAEFAGRQGSAPSGTRTIGACRR